jgi:hypothetical protein
MKNKSEKTVHDRGQKAEGVGFLRQKRLLDDRRKNSDRGYMYISTVGWIDRRENCRRCSDNYMAIG